MGSSASIHRDSCGLCACKAKPLFFGLLKSTLFRVEVCHNGNQLTSPLGCKSLESTVTVSTHVATVVTWICFVHWNKETLPPISLV